MNKPDPAHDGAPKDDRHGPLPSLLLILTVVTGLVDAVSYLRLGHVFVANMTGNVVFLGFAAAGATDLSVLGSLAATAAFLGGALAGGRLGVRLGGHRGRFLANAVYLHLALIASAFAVSIPAFGVPADVSAFALIVLLALAMGLQNAAARRLSVPDLTTTVLTLTLTGLAADSTLAGGHDPNLKRRLAAVATMWFGATAGAFLALRFGVSWVLALATGLLAWNAIQATRLSTSSAAWTVGT